MTGLCVLLACQPVAPPLDLVVGAGDLVMIALNPFPERASRSSPSVSLYKIQAGDSLGGAVRWTFIESRNPPTDRLSHFSNADGALIISTSTRATELVLWRVPTKALHSDPIKHDALIRLRTDPPPGPGYRCFEPTQDCKSKTGHFIGPTFGESCLLNDFGEAARFQRNEDGWTQIDTPDLSEFALELRDIEDSDCDKNYAPWDI